MARNEIDFKIYSYTQIETVKQKNDENLPQRENGPMTERVAERNLGIL